MAKKYNISDNLGTNTKANDVIFIYEPAEVVDIILNSSHPLYKQESDIGAILFRRVESDYKKTNQQLSIAHQLDTFSKQYPLLHEIVLIYKALSPFSSIKDKAVGYYYKTIVNVWGLQNHNILPYSTQNVISANSTSISNFTGNNQANDDIKFGEYFNENIKIPNLLPFEGDVTYSGRYGNSMRFSSTTKKDINNWSSKGEIGEPIIIIRNDKNTSEDSYIVEDINKDNCSIYLTDGQSIDFKPDISISTSYIKNEKPITVNQFVDSQIFLTANRVNINSKNDSILMTANKSVNVIANKYIEFNADKIYIGNSSNEEEPSVLGTQLLDTLDSIIDTLNSLITELLTATVGTPVGPSTPFLPPAAINIAKIKVDLLTFKSNLDTTKYILSKKTFLE